ncbi:putative dead deah box protein [Rosellinia necatrix]|uniref:Putative dead deah box protein n=1 Tax=Rosellinia necatrix TaxID=77044 RepID=A0A1W2TDS2_ROSNE|nr:putative dead deah box protein [Rosellinia necatrix]
MATSSKHSPTPERIASEDPDTAAARKELRQTAISEKPNLFAMAATNARTDNAVAPSDDASNASDASGKAVTPEQEPHDGVAKEQMASPKKKRAHDEVDQPKDATTGASADGDVSPIGANGSASLDRADRSEPEKKRPRDVSSEIKANSTTTTALAGSASAPTPPTEKKGESASSSLANADGDRSPPEKKNNTTTSAFKSSGMSSFATQSSPFLQAGTGQPLSSFSSTKSPPTLSSSTKSIFSNSKSSSNGAVSPFGQITSTATFGSSTFGSNTFGNSTFGGFGSSLGGPRLTAFGKPGESLKGGKPAKPFGAPASENEGGSDEEEDGNASDNEKDAVENQDAEEDKIAEAEDKKKTRLQRVAVDDGEAGEFTIIQVRGRVYNLDKASNSWKERGAGNLKVNVPMACVRADNLETPLSGAFDASALKDAESKVVRLIMRQDSTHRVILNTAIIPAMKFQEKSSLKATYILFTAIEDEGAVSIQIRMNATSAKSFLSEVESVQRQLQSV